MSGPPSPKILVAKKKFGNCTRNLECRRSKITSALFLLSTFLSSWVGMTQNISFIIFFFDFLQIYGWEHEPYNSTQLTDNMQEDIKNIIYDTNMPSKKKDGMIWFSCEGENPADRENIGPIKYYPDPGVPKFFYPYKNQAGYHSPAVFAHFEEPKRKQYFINLTTKIKWVDKSTFLSWYLSFLLKYSF